MWATIGGKLYHTTDGINWTVIHQGPGLNWIAVSPQNPQHFYVSGTNGVYKTTDGTTFQLMAGSPPKATRLTIDSQERVYVTSWRNTGGLWKFANGTWSKIHNNLYIAAVAVDPQDPNRIVISTHDHPYHDRTFATGIWASNDGGLNWIQANAGLGCTRGETITFNPHNPTQLVFGTGGRGYFVGSWPKNLMNAAKPTTAEVTTLSSGRG